MLGKTQPLGLVCDDEQALHMLIAHSPCNTVPLTLASSGLYSVYT